MKSKQSTRSKTTRHRPVRRTEPGSPTPSVSATLHKQIATRAYEHYERRIRQGPRDDWLPGGTGDPRTRKLTEC